MKKKFLKILSITTILVALGLIITNFVFKEEVTVASESSLTFNYDGEQRSPFTNKAYDNYATKYRKVTLGENAAVCVDYGKGIPSNGTSLSFKEKMSPEALAVLVYGYPNKDLGEFGMSTEEEKEVQYLVTQMAFWNVTTRTGENKGLKFNFDDLIASSGYENIMGKMKSAAEKLANTAMNSPYNPNPAIKIDTSNYKKEEKSDLLVVGPYKITGYDGGTTTDFTVLDVNASLENAPSTAFIADVNGNRKETFAIGDEVYVIARKSDNIANFKLTVNASGNKLSCGKYGLSSSSGIQDFATIVTDPVTVSETVNITWSNDAGNITIIKKDQNGEKIKDVRFEISNSSGQKIAETVTNSEGRVDLLNLPLGIYSIKEISAPQGYTIDSTLRTVIVTAGATQNVEFINVKPSGKLQIAKRDENGDPVSNVKFKIMDSNRKKIQTITTNSKGIATTQDLDKGVYYFEEIDAPDYVILDSEEYSFEITSYDQTVKRQLVNEIVKGSLKITKKDENGELLSGVKFEILDYNKSKIDTITTNNSGVAVSKKLEPGTYYYKEISTKNKNLIVDSNEKEFTITDTTSIVEKQETNYYKKGTLKIIKVDPSNKPIEGVKFEIYNDDKSKIDTIVTNLNGIAESTTKMVLGTYYYKEVSGPSNVELDQEMKEFKLTENNQVLEISITNKLLSMAEVDSSLKGAPSYTDVVLPEKMKSAKFIINKINKDTGEPLQNIRFEIFDSNKNIIASIVTDVTGKAETEELKAGTYYYKEVTAPDNIVIDAKEYEFKIEEQGSNVEKTVYNSQKRLPVTGSLFSTNVIIVIIVSVSCILVYIVIKMVIAYVKNRD